MSIAKMVFLKKYGLIDFVILILLVLTSCTIKDPQKPDWNTDLSVPLINETYMVNELETSDYFTVTDSLIYFSSSGQFQGEIIPNDINLKSKTSELMQVQTNSTISGYLPIDENDVYNESSGLLETLQIRYAKIGSWLLQIETDLTVPIDEMIISFHEVYDSNGNNKNIVITDFTQTHIENMQGLFIGTQDNEELIPNLNFDITTISSNELREDAGSVRLFFEGNDLITSRIFFAFFHGRMKNKNFSMNDYSQLIDVEYPYNLDQAIEPYGVSLNLTLSNSLGFDVILRAVMTGYNDTTGDSMQIVFDENYPETIRANAAPSPGEHSVTNITLFESIGELIALIPNRVNLTDVKFIAAPGFNHDGFAYSGTNSSGIYEFFVPFTFRINESVITPEKIVETIISEENQEYITKYAVSAVLELELLNRLPLGAGIDVYMSTVNDTAIIFNPQLYPEYPSLYFTDEADTIRITAADNSNINNPPVSSQISLTLSKADVDFFNNERFYTAMKIHLYGSDEIVIIKPSDYIAVKGFLFLKAHVNFDD
ncbi:MAG: hypothetical protein PHR06_01990 [Candidatus Cloacimonetes bacterium]|nr:hypothetical protein [Candidatus Cloacimonadota bacterium]